MADSNADILLDPNGNVLQTYTCASLPGCQGPLFAISLDPSGTSFWTGDSTSGDIWQVDIATGDVLQTIDTHSGSSSASPSMTRSSGHGAPRHSRRRTHASRHPARHGRLLLAHRRLGRLDQPVHRHADPERAGDLHPERLRDCTATTDATGTATCVITPGRALEIVHADGILLG